MCVGNPTIIGTDNGLSPGRRQAIIWTNAGKLSVRSLGTNFGENLSEISAFSFKKMHLKMSPGKWRPFFLGLNMLTHWGREKMTAIFKRHFNCLFVIQNVSIVIYISLKFVPEGPINNILALIQIMAWCHSGNKPLSEPMMVSLPTHPCVTRPQWVNSEHGGCWWPGIVRCLDISRPIMTTFGSLMYKTHRTWRIKMCFTWTPFMNTLFQRKMCSHMC